jgi:hypothetical protein
MKKLKAPIGADGANVGTTLFPIDADGNVTVPDDAAQTLVGVGGFQIVTDIPEADEGQTVLVSTVGAQSCSFGADSYSTDENGYVTVPTAMVASLLSHGFTIPPTPAVTESIGSHDQVEAEPVAAVELPQIPLGSKLGLAPVETPVASYAAEVAQ